MSTLLDVQNMTICFPTERGNIYAPKEFSLTLRSGEILGLAGDSGCGKSAFASALLGILERPGRAVSGAALFTGQDGSGVDLLRITEQEFQSLRGGEIGMIFQDPVASLHPSRRIRAQFRETLRARGLGAKGSDGRNRMREALQRMMFADPDKILRSYPFELSGGMCQRVAIAFSLALNPRLLIADEPTTALDVKNQAQVLRLLRDMRDQTGMSVILISHDIAVVSAAADRIMQM
ncbi:MAG: ABC transporter ATP-binding protein [Gracilibacteraceae bacterium]|jgi:ABC-type dipeptide/oligopeptide/nickel transport system ATPase component|nr:ABC transporter ATP-binding protein [Gracilibacteraceae bacterium]